MKHRDITMQKGNALLLVMVFFVAISLSTAAGLVAPVIRANRVATNNLDSKQSYFVAESGAEDVLYRLLSARQVSSTESLTLGAHTATTLITDTGNGKQLDTVGDVVNRIRKVSLTLTEGIGASFNYGVQTGRGGLIMSNGASIVGNVYANGNITGGVVTGTAVAANSAALSADQANDMPTTPTQNLTFRTTATTADLAQSFTLSSDGPVNKVQLYIKKVGTPANATVRIVSDQNGTPSTTNLLTTQGTLSASLVTTSYGWLEVVFPSNPTLYANTPYWLIIDNSSTSASSYYVLGANDGVYSAGSAKLGAYGGTWNTASPNTLDAYFKLYLGGLTSAISGTDVGLTSAEYAWAHTISGGSSAGTKYCQVGTGCNTSRSDPSPVPFPISDANITQWKEDALAGGTTNSSYTVSGTATLGPRKIVGDLTVTNGAVLTLTGTVWVTGDVTVSNNGQIKLASAYGTNDGVLVADGTIRISNNGTMNGSGTTGSYLLALTTSNCPTGVGCNGAYAIDVSNNAGAVVLNAQKGTIHINNNAGLVEATAETLLIDNNATVTYQTGLANMNFTSGPGGSWNIASWQEVE